MDQIPLISVCMPVYNADRYLATAIDSILNQTFTDFEFLIVDDGSSDRSLQILKQYAETDPRIHLISRPNTGLVVALNEMLAIAKGEFLARMDADDISFPTRLANQIHFLQQHPEVVCVGGAYEVIDPKGRVVSRNTMPEGNAEIQRQILLGSTVINHPCAMIRRDALLKIGGYDTAMTTAEDLDMLLKLGEIGQLANIPDLVVQYRFHPTSVSAQNILHQREVAQEACRRAWHRRGIEGSFDVQPVWYRPLPDRASQLAFLHKYGWWAFCNGSRETAMRCGLRAIALQPTSIENWKLFGCALIKPSPNLSYLIYE